MSRSVQTVRRPRLVETFVTSRVWLLGSLVMLAGCATNPQPADEAVDQTLAERGAAPGPLLADAHDPARRQAALKELLAQPLTPEIAARIALINNRELRATLANARYAEADLIQAAKLPNPILTAGTRWPSGGGPVTNTFSASFDILDAFLIPLRTRMARQALTAAEQDAAHRALTLMGEVQTAWHRLGTLEEWRDAIAAFHAEDAARVGGLQNAGKLAVAHAKQLEGETREELARADAAVAAAREKLNTLMGFAEAPRWKLAGPSPAVPSERHDVGTLEKKALVARLDLASSRTEAALVKQAYDLEERTRWSPVGVQVGVETERESSGRRLTGPTVKAGLPLFDQGQADLLRLRIALDQATDRVTALEVETRSRVRLAAAQVEAAQRSVESCQRVVGPQAGRVWSEQLKLASRGKADPLALHLARRDLIAAKRREIEARYEYWRARVALATALRG